MKFQSGLGLGVKFYPTNHITYVISINFSNANPSTPTHYIYPYKPHTHSECAYEELREGSIEYDTSINNYIVTSF